MEPSGLGSPVVCVPGNGEKGRLALGAVVSRIAGNCRGLTARSSTASCQPTLGEFLYLWLYYSRTHTIVYPLVVCEP